MIVFVTQQVKELHLEGRTIHVHGSSSILSRYPNHIGTLPVLLEPFLEHLNTLRRKWCKERHEMLVLMCTH